MIELKEHNRKPYEELSRKLEEVTRVGFVSATGTGKSYVGAKYVEENKLENGTLILVPSNAIREGWKGLLPEATILTYQALLNSNVNSSPYSLIICDELHHLGAGKWGVAFRRLVEEYGGKILGMSATPVRFLDNSRDMVEEVFEGNRVVGVELPEAIDKGILPSFDYISALYTIPKLKKEKAKGELTEKLYKKLDVMENEYSFQAIMAKHMKPGNHKVAVFVPSIPEIEKYMGVISAIYPNALHLAAHSKMTDAAIRAAVRRFEEASQTAFIYTVDLLNEGVHIDGVDTIIMFRRTESPTIFLQQLGRALTTSQAGERITVFDFVANHMNLKGKHDGAGNVIDWIVEGIENPERQIIRADYAKEEWEVLDRLRELLSRQWTEEEDEIIKSGYKERRKVSEIQKFLPKRTTSQIEHRALALGITRKTSKHPEGFLETVKDLYPLGGPSAVIAIYPQFTAEQVRAFAKVRGIKYRPIVGEKWTEEEIQILLSNPDLMPSELKLLLPAKTAHQITNKRSQLGIARTREMWTEAEDKLIRDNQNLTAQEIHDRFLPQKNVAIINARRLKLCGKRLGRERWTEAEDEILKTNVHSSKEVLLPLLPGRTERAINARRELLGLPGWCGLKFVRWSVEEESILRNYVRERNGFSEKDYEALRSFFPNRSLESVRGKAYTIMKERGGLKCEN